MTENKEISSEEKVNEIFEKIEFLELTSEQKEEAAKEIVENIAFDKLYFLEICLSTIIIVFWLFQDSAVVVIGWMIISTIIRPINWLSFSIARWVGKVLVESLLVLVYSVFLVIIISFLLTKFIWSWETNEIITRTTPNLIDFFIAVFSWVFWVLWIKYKRSYQSLSGFIFAVSIHPPLCVIWIEMAYLNYKSAFWALLLFGSNILWVILISTIILWLYGFTPHGKKLQGKVFKRILFFLFCLIMILVPLSLASNSMKVKKNLSSETEKFLTKNLEKKVKYFEIENIKIIENSNEKIHLKIVLKLSEESNLENIFQDLKRVAEQELGKKVDIDFDIIKFYKI